MLKKLSNAFGPSGCEDEVRDIIKNSKRGQRIQIENIRVNTPDGEERVLDTPITIDIKN